MVAGTVDAFAEARSVSPATKPRASAVAVGGGMNSPLWTSIVNDVTGRHPS
jgi:sugar (pentulose or hexulose) kinase